MKRDNTIYLAILLLLVVFSCLSLVGEGQSLQQEVFWRTGDGAYSGCRIPSVIVSSKGTVLAFAEGRNDGGDSGDIDLLLKRSTDNGQTWGDVIMVWNDKQNTCGNPCPVVDEETGRIWLWMTWNYGKDNEGKIVFKKSEYPRSPYLCYSDDDGLTWSKPVDMSMDCKDPSWGWYATGPGFGIQVKNGKYKGRLIIPANHSYDDPNGKVGNGPYGYGAHVLISDDHGKTWRKSEPIRPGCNESQVTELSDGTLEMNMRSYNGKNCRAVSYSRDGGENWSPVTNDYQLVESVCQASILNYGNYKGKAYHLFSNPAVPVGRTHMTIRISDDDCQTWAISKLLYAGPSAYSCLVHLPNGNIGVLFETGEKNAYEKLNFISIPAKMIFDMKNIQSKN